MTTTSIEVFHMINYFVKVHNIKKEVTLYLPDDNYRTQIQIRVAFSTLFLYRLIYTLAREPNTK